MNMNCDHCPCVNRRSEGGCEGGRCQRLLFAQPMSNGLGSWAPGGCDLSEEVFFHGTSDAFTIENNILLPPVFTGVQREDGRQKHTDMVFFTPSLPSAEQYSEKACAKYGGKPVVYEVVPIGDYYSILPGEYVAGAALVVGTLNTRRSADR